MTMTTTSATVGGILPAEYGPLIVQPVQQQSVAIQASTVLSTNASSFHVPVVTADPAAAWVAEGAEITAKDATLAELVITPSKIAGLTAITAELADDSNPAAAQIVGDGLARSIADTLDAAFFGTQGSNTAQQKGLGDLTGVGTIDAGVTAWANLDPFAAALAAAEKVGATLTSFVANPDDALALAQLKDETGSNRPLLGVDPTQPTQRLIHGVPLRVSRHATKGTVWGVPAARSLVVLRNDVTLEVDRSVYFTSHRVAVRAVMRVGLGFPHAAAVQKITLKTTAP